MNKKIESVWAVSLLILCVTSLTLAICGITGIDPPDYLTRTLGILCLAALPFLAYSTVKIKIMRKKSQ